MQTTERHAQRKSNSLKALFLLSRIRRVIASPPLYYRARTGRLAVHFLCTFWGRKRPKKAAFVPPFRGSKISETPRYAKDFPHLPPTTSRARQGRSNLSPLLLMISRELCRTL